MNSVKKINMNFLLKGSKETTSNYFVKSCVQLTSCPCSEEVLVMEKHGIFSNEGLNEPCMPKRHV